MPTWHRKRKLQSTAKDCGGANTEMARTQLKHRICTCMPMHSRDIPNPTSDIYNPMFVITNSIFQIPSSTFDNVIHICIYIYIKSQSLHLKSWSLCLRTRVPPWKTYPTLFGTAISMFRGPTSLRFETYTLNLRAWDRFGRAHTPFTTSGIIFLKSMILMFKSQICWSGYQLILVKFLALCLDNNIIVSRSCSFDSAGSPWRRNKMEIRIALSRTRNIHAFKTYVANLDARTLFEDGRTLHSRANYQFDRQNSVFENPRSVLKSETLSLSFRVLHLT